MITRTAKVKLLDFSNHYEDLYKNYGTKNYMPPEHQKGRHRGIVTDFAALDLMFANFSDKPPYAYSLDKVQAEARNLYKKLKRGNVKTEAIIKHRSVAASIIFAFLLGVLFIVSPKNKNLMAASDSGVYKVFLTSKKWAYVEVSDKIKGYTPLHFYTKNKKVKIKWMNHDSSGDLFLSLKEAKSKILLERVVNKKE